MLCTSSNRTGPISEGSVNSFTVRSLQTDNTRNCFVVRFHEADCLSDIREPCVLLLTSLKPGTVGLMCML